MKYFILNRSDELSIQLSEKVHHLCEEHGMKVDRENPDIVLSIGGDGTMLHAFHSYLKNIEHIAFVGIHTGHLGFYADWNPNEIESLISIMSASQSSLQQHIVKYPIAEIEIETLTSKKTYYALNEMTLKGVDATLVAELHINDHLFETFRGDGICISTPSGSTAYNKSLSGAIVHPSMPSIQIAEMSSINNRIFRTLGSSMVLPQHHHCDIYPRADQHLKITIDHMQMEIEQLVNIRCSVSEKQVRFARFRPFPFWNRVKEAFIGDVQ
ncbi:NAD kinase [Longirhabdus pacifica]|uniref:NAD kinase n=1 Tax=Longirhabdus pacifica TaxID=2305227 RepID=UPI001008E12E|nr:NAD kinase [Longirhabdus pacifica]